MRKDEIKKFLPRLLQALVQSVKQDRYLQLGFMVCSFLLIGFTFSHCVGSKEKVYVSTEDVDFKKGRLIDSQDAQFYKKRDQLQAERVRRLLESQEVILKRLGELENKAVSDTGGTSLEDQSSENTPPENASSQNEVEERSVKLGEAGTLPVRIYEPSENYKVQGPDKSDISPAKSYRPTSASFKGTPKRAKSGVSIISFPVKKTKKQEVGVTLPSGSFVKARILTGVDAPQGKAYPSLLALDYAFIAPNNYRIDLSGCFIIAKAQGDLSTERVQMQPTKLSCVARSGKMFEREVTGFVADQNDNNFALQGKLNSKQGRVMSMAFLSSVVEGIGNAVKQAQTTQATNAVGGSSSIVSGDEGKYIAAGGMSNAASQVTQWYLSQAQNLLPTINVGAGQDIWVVMTDKVELPNDYFKKNQRGKNEKSEMEYLRRLFN